MFGKFVKKIQRGHLDRRHRPNFILILGEREEVVQSRLFYIHVVYGLNVFRSKPHPISCLTNNDCTHSDTVLLHNAGRLELESILLPEGPSET